MTICRVEVDSLVDSFSQVAFEGKAAWFLGAGVSRPSGLVSWFELLQPLARELGITLQTSDDLPDVAQYYINIASGNRAPLIHHMRREFERRAAPNSYHRHVARSSVSTIWTTNYDDLMELALADLKRRVRIRESDLTELTGPGTVEIIKAHGSFGVSSPEEFVISKSDYEDYAAHRPAMTARLRSDLLTKSYLFVGYGYEDPNIRVVLTEARRLAGRVMPPHWMLCKAVDQKDSEKTRRQELWKADLARIGIQCVLVEDFALIEQIVGRVARRSRGPTVYVTGAHDGDDPRAREVGKLLSVAKPPVIVLDGQSAGVSRSLLTAFQAECVDRRIDLNERLRFYPNPYAADAKFSSDASLLPVLKQWRATMLRQAHSVLAFDGGMGTRAEVEIAIELGCCIVPVPTGKAGSASALLDHPSVSADLDKRSPQYREKARSLALTAEDIVSCIQADMPKWSL